jgi:hypothetical protein
MKETRDVHVALFSETFGKAFAEMTRSLDAYRRENAALRDLLLERGLKQQLIRREVRKRMKNYQIYEEATALNRKVCQGILDLLRTNDPLENVLENSAKTGKKDVN